MQRVVGTPWSTTPGKSKDDDEMVMPEVAIDMKAPDAVSMPRPEPNMVEGARRRVYPEAKDFDENGFTAECKGCVALMRVEMQRASR